MTAVATLEGVSRRAGSRVRLQGIDVVIESGKTTGLLGPAGSGKTTLTRLIAGLLRPDRGTIRILGMEMGKEATAVAPLVGYMPQQCGLHGDLTVQENLDLHAALHGLPRESRSATIHTLAGIADLDRFGSSRIATLPIAVRQRVALACALVGSPRLLLLDEPNAARDPILQRDLLAIVGDLTTADVGVLWVTAAFAEAEPFDQVLMLHEGRLIAQGSPRDLAGGLSGRVRSIRALGHARHTIAARLHSTPSVRDVQIRASSVRFSTSGEASETGCKLGEGADEVVSVPPALEDVFIDLLDDWRRPIALPFGPPSRSHDSAHEPAIECRKLTRRFGDKVEVDGVDLVAARGEVVGIAGPSASGKTTILQLLSGLLRPTSGKVRIGGVDLQSAPARSRVRAGYMSQSFSLYGELSVVENLRLFSDIYGASRKDSERRIGRLTAELRLEGILKTRCDSLAVGEKQRAALAATLVHAPDLILLDEPTAELDPPRRRDVWNCIIQRAAEGATVFVASRSFLEVETCDQVLLLHEGRTLAAGTPDALLTKVGKSTLEDAFLALAMRRQGGGA